MGEFHSTEISGISGSKSNGTMSFRKFVSKISVHLSRLSFFFWKFGNSENFLFHLYLWQFYQISPCSFISREKLQDGGESFESTLHWMQNDLPQFEPVLDHLFSTKTLGSQFLENCGLVVPNFLWFSSPGLHTLPRESS